jgi:putative heme-binding domain-containing protein
MKWLKCLLAASFLALALCCLPKTLAQPQAQGERLFQVHCAGCHGPRGEGGLGPTLAAPVLARATNDETLFGVIKNGIPGTEMPRSRLTNDELRQLTAFVRELGRTPVEKIAGSAQRGEKLFAEKGDCFSCHAFKGRGSVFAPDLTDIGLKRGAAHLRVSLVEPGADVPKSFSMWRAGTSIADNFVQVRVVTKEGKSLSGVRVNEDTFSIQLRDASGRVHSFFKSELAELHKDWGKSAMPSYRTTFTKEELDDVVAFLVSLRGDQ